VPGIGPAKAVQLKAAFELGRRSMLDWQNDRFQITSPASAASSRTFAHDPQGSRTFAKERKPQTQWPGPE
jgi:DNA repair protein RadC